MSKITEALNDLDEFIALEKEINIYENENQLDPRLSPKYQEREDDIKRRELEAQGRVNAVNRNFGYRPEITVAPGSPEYENQVRAQNKWDDRLNGLDKNLFQRLSPLNWSYDPRDPSNAIQANEARKAKDTFAQTQKERHQLDKDIKDTTAWNNLLGTEVAKPGDMNAHNSIRGSISNFMGDNIGSPGQTAAMGASLAALGGLAYLWKKKRNADQRKQDLQAIINPASRFVDWTTPRIGQGIDWAANRASDLIRPSIQGIGNGIANAPGNVINWMGNRIDARNAADAQVAAARSNAEAAATRERTINDLITNHPGVARARMGDIDFTFRP